MNDLEKTLKELMLNPLNDEEKVILYKNILKDKYTCDFRHQYSRISTLIQNADDNEIQILFHNLETIQEKLLDEPNSDLGRGFSKLYDHIKLESGRKQQIVEILHKEKENYLNIIKRYSEEVDNIKNDLEKKNETVSVEIDEKIEEVKKDVNDYVSETKVDIIALLSLFAGLILAFSGSLSFTSSILEGLSNADLKTVCLSGIICGLVTFDTISLMLHYICKIVFKKEKPDSYDAIILFVNVIFAVLFLIVFYTL